MENIEILFDSFLDYHALRMSQENYFADCCALVGIPYDNTIDDVELKANCLQALQSGLKVTHELAYWLPLSTGMVCIIAVCYRLLQSTDNGWFHIKEYQICDSKKKPIKIIAVEDFDKVLLELQELLEWQVSESFTIAQAQLFADYIGRNNGEAIQKRVVKVAGLLHYAQHEVERNPKIPLGNVGYYVYWLMGQYVSYVKECQFKQQEMTYRRDFIGFLFTFEAKLIKGQDWDEDVELSTQNKAATELINSTVKRALKRESPNPTAAIETNGPIKLPM